MKLLSSPYQNRTVVLLYASGFINNFPLITKNNSSSLSCLCQVNSPLNLANLIWESFKSPTIFGVQYSLNRFILFFTLALLMVLSIFIMRLIFLKKFAERSLISKLNTTRINYEVLLTTRYKRKVPLFS